MPNFDGLNEIRLTYTVPVGTQELTHVQTFDVIMPEVYAPGTDWDEIEVSNHVGGSQPITAFITDYLALLGALFSTVVNFQTIEYWRIPEGTFDATFISAAGIGDVGASASQPQPAQQTILTFRTAGGGVMKLYLLEGYISSQTKQAYPTGDANINALMAFVLGTEQPFVGRDNTRPIAAMNASFGQNEAVWRKRFRP